MKSKLSREVIHATGVHETERVPNGLCAQHSLACDWTDASISQRGTHHTS